MGSDPCQAIRPDNVRLLMIRPCGSCFFTCYKGDTMDLMSVLKERRSIRNFTEEDVSDQDLQKLLEAVQWSPSWANTQCWEVVVVRDSGMKTTLAETLLKGNPGKKAMQNAPLVLVLAARKNDSGYYKGAVTTKFGDWLMFDLGIAAQSISLCAHALGLGSVIIGLFDQDKARQALGMPDTLELVAMLPVGRPAKVPSPPKRKELNEIVHYETYGKRAGSQ